MRRLAAIVAVLGLGAATSASAIENQVIEQEGNVRLVKQQRWAYDLQGKEIDPARVCPSGNVNAMSSYRTRKDYAYAIFSLGWYTPKTVVVECGSSTNRASRDRDLMSPTTF